MLSENLKTKIKELVKEHRTTQDGFINAILEHAVINGGIDLSKLSFKAAKPKGRKAKGGE